MAYIKATNPKEQEHFDYLEEFRQSGDTNMFGASPYLQAAFGLSKDEAVKILSAWMKAHHDKSRWLEGPSSKEKVEVEFVTSVRREKSKRR